MPTIINNPPGQSNEDGSSLGLILGVIITILTVVILFFIYGLPSIRSNNTPATGTNINVQLPTNTYPSTNSSTPK